MCRTCCTIISNLEVIKPLVSLYACFEATLSGLDRQATVRFFPHEVADLAVALEFAQILNRARTSANLWSTQHMALLWISLICMIPFDLAQFNEVGREGETEATIEEIAKQSLTSSGIVRESAAILLSRLYVRYQICKVSRPVNSTHYRRDMLPRLSAFFDWAKTCAKEQKNIFEVHHS